MSFLSVFFRFVLLFLVVGVVGFFGTREALLYIASQQVAVDAKQVTVPSRWKDFTSLCESSLTSEAPFDGFQLRFVSANEYKLEVHCVSTAPALWQAKKLPYGVVKTTGSPGFYFDFENQVLSGELTLELWGQKRVVFADSNVMGHNWGSTQLRASVPASVCAAHGLTCCDAAQEIGQGDLQSDGVTDCSGQCYTSCLQRPLILSFQSDPFADYETRQINLESGSNLVLFSFVVDDRQAPIKKVTIDFGDGTSQTFEARNGQATKSFECAKEPCAYTVTVEAEDERGITSAKTRLTSLIVLVGAAPVAQ